MVSYILFDLDNTLYPESSGFQEEIRRRMTEYVSQFLGTTFDEAAALRHTHLPEYGTTLKWLTVKHGFKNFDDFLKKVHPEDVSAYIERNTGLTEILRSIPQKKSILTNSPREHALRVLRHLEIEHFFEHVFDIRFHDFSGKPALSSYNRVLETIGKKASDVLFIDDLPLYLIPFRDLGGKIVCIRQNGPDPEFDVPYIRDLGELPGFITMQNV